MKKISNATRRSRVNILKTKLNALNALEIQLKEAGKTLSVIKKHRCARIEKRIKRIEDKIEVKGK